MRGINYMAVTGLMILTGYGCADLIVREDDSSQATTGKVASRVLLGIATLGLSEASIATRKKEMEAFSLPITSGSRGNTGTAPLQAWASDRKQELASLEEGLKSEEAKLKEMGTEEQDYRNAKEQFRQHLEEFRKKAAAFNSELAARQRSLGQSPKTPRWVVWGNHPAMVNGVISALHADGQIVVERARLDEIFNEQKIRLTHTSDDEAQLLKVGKLVGADRIAFAQADVRQESRSGVIVGMGVGGGFSNSVYHVSVNLRGVNVETGEIIWTGSATFDKPIPNPDAGAERVNDFETPSYMKLLSKDRECWLRWSPVWVD